MLVGLGKFGASSVGFAHGVEEGVHASFFDFTDVRHEFSETAFWKGALLEPDEVFLREIEDGDPARRILFFSEHAEGHVSAVDFLEEVAKIIKVDFGKMHIRRVARFRF